LTPLKFLEMPVNSSMLPPIRSLKTIAWAAFESGPAPDPPLAETRSADSGLIFLSHHLWLDNHLDGPIFSVDKGIKALGVFFQWKPVGDHLVAFQHARLEEPDDLVGDIWVCP